MTAALPADRDRSCGSVLMLVPAAVLVLVVLGAIAVDSAVAFLGQREASNAAAAAANDAAAALSDASFYGSGALVVDQGRARSVAAAAVSARSSRGLVVDDIAVQVDGPAVCVTVRATVPYIFGRGLPGAAHAARVTGRAAAMAVAGPAGTPVGSPGRACR
jgi:Flp pilus assembly protein TadG